LDIISLRVICNLLDAFYFYALHTEILTYLRYSSNL
jgi:hypothetical protein